MSVTTEVKGTTECRVMEGRYGDDILYCDCNEVIGIRLKSSPLVVTRNGTRIFIPCPDGVIVGCPKCRKEWLYDEGRMVLKI